MQFSRNAHSSLDQPIIEFAPPLTCKENSRYRRGRSKTRCGFATGCPSRIGEGDTFRGCGCSRRSSASRTFSVAVSSEKGGSGGRSISSIRSSCAHAEPRLQVFVFCFEPRDMRPHRGERGINFLFGKSRRYVLRAIPVECLQMKQKSALRLGRIAWQRQSCGKLRV